MQTGWFRNNLDGARMYNVDGYLDVHARVYKYPYTPHPTHTHAHPPHISQLSAQRA